MLHKQQNLPQEYAQTLTGHADEKMTTHYQVGHSEKKIEHLEACAELAF
ncbi:Integrase [Pseudomonas sessilinigenes]|nr:Integrase [Pseudomonas sessilinigenes]